MLSEDIARRRTICHLHFLARNEQRGIHFTGEEIASIESAIERLRPAFERANNHRYKLRIKHQGEIYIVIYDTQFLSVVSIWRKDEFQ